LAAVAEATNSTDLRLSSRNIAKATKLARSAVVRAIDSLTNRQLLLTTRQGTATRPSAYQLNFLLTAKMGGPLT